MILIRYRFSAKHRNVRKQMNTQNDRDDSHKGSTSSQIIHIWDTVRSRARNRVYIVSTRKTINNNRKQPPANDDWTV